MRIFKTKEFGKLARREGLTNRQLMLAVDEMESGLVDADLGSHLYKKRIAQGNKGKSGSYRTLLAFKTGTKTFFLFFTQREKEKTLLQKRNKLLRSSLNNILSYQTNS
jgi:hypothetical protein